MHQNSDFIIKFEKLLTQGKAKEVSKLISAVATSEIAPNHILQLTRQARKSHKTEIAMLLLRQYLDFSNLMNSDNYPELQIEYAACLIKKEISTAAIQILNKFDYSIFPQILLYQSLGHFAEYNFHLAIPLLEIYCNCDNISYHEKLAGFLNLAMALLYNCQFEQAQTVLTKLIPQLSDLSVLTLLAQCYLLLAQVHLHLGNYKNANISLSNSEKTINRFHMPDQLRRKKWKLVIWSLQNRSKIEFYAEKFRQLRVEAKTLNDFETIRDLDAWYSVLVQNQDLFQFVFFGTSSLSYRKCIFSSFGEKINIPDYYYKTLGKTKNTNAIPKFDLFLTEKDNIVQTFALSANTNRLSQLLCTDFYRPFSLCKIFNQLYPLEIFDPLTDPQRIYEHVRLTNILFREKQLPLKINSTATGYILNSTEPCKLLIPIDTARRTECFEETLIRKSQTNIFSSKEAQSWTNSPLSTLNRKLNGLVKAGYLLKLGSGKSTRYLWKKFDENNTIEKSKIL
jgi:hypothetical protein